MMFIKDIMTPSIPSAEFACPCGEGDAVTQGARTQRYAKGPSHQSAVSRLFAYFKVPSAAWAAATRATGTRKGEQLT